LLALHCKQQWFPSLLHWLVSSSPFVCVVAKTLCHPLHAVQGSVGSVHERGSLDHSHPTLSPFPLVFCLPTHLPPRRLDYSQSITSSVLHSPQPTCTSLCASFSFRSNWGSCWLPTRVDRINNLYNHQDPVE
jgi:hypothetical protein